VCKLLCAGKLDAVEDYNTRGLIEGCAELLVLDHLGRDEGDFLKVREKAQARSARHRVV
jgi:hypothetical protein